MLLKRDNMLLFQSFKGFPNSALIDKELKKRQANKAPCKLSTTAC